MDNKNKKIFSALYKEKLNRGFTLLLSILLASLLTSLGLSMYSIASKELRLSSTGRESQYAFYAADTGLECALYWEFKKNAFATSTVYTTSNPQCAGKDLLDFPTNGGEWISDGVVGLGGAAETKFWFEANSRCVFVTVTKQNFRPRTKIVALGYNTKCNDTVNPRRVERAVSSIF